MCRNFWVVRVLCVLLDGTQRWTRAAKVRKILFVEKEKEMLYGSVRKDPETSGPWVRLEIGFYSFFFNFPRAEVFLVRTDVSWEEVSTWLIICPPPGSQLFNMLWVGFVDTMASAGRMLLKWPGP
jgi:hypothetical protein